MHGLVLQPHQRGKDDPQPRTPASMRAQAGARGLAERPAGAARAGAPHGAPPLLRLRQVPGGGRVQQVPGAPRPAARARGVCALPVLAMQSAAKQTSSWRVPACALCCTAGSQATASMAPDRLSQRQCADSPWDSPRTARGGLRGSVVNCRAPAGGPRRQLQRLHLAGGARPLRTARRTQWPHRAPSPPRLPAPLQQGRRLPAHSGDPLMGWH